MRTDNKARPDGTGSPWSTTTGRTARAARAAKPRAKVDRRATVTRIEIDWFHAGGCSEHQRALFQKFALTEAPHVRAEGFDPVRYGSRQTWLLTTTNTRTTAALAAVTEIINLEGTK